MDIGSLIDALPHFRQLGASDFAMQIRHRLARLFPNLSSVERETIVRRFFRYRRLNRMIYRFTVLMPEVAALVSRCIPVTGRALMVDANKHPGPIIVASAHFGSVFFLVLIVARSLPGRRLYVMHEKTNSDSARDTAFLERRGIISVGADARGLLTLIRALQSNPRTAVLLAFDPPLGNQHVVPFLATRIPVSTGVGLLADMGDCPVVPWFWQYRGLRPSIAIEKPIFPDQHLPGLQRRNAVVDALYALLERRVAHAPEQWHMIFFRETLLPQNAIPPNSQVNAS